MAICEIAVTRKEGLPDPRGNDVSLEANRVLGIRTDVTTATVYRVEGLDEEQAKLLAEKALIDPVTEEGSIGGNMAYAVAFVGDDFVHIDRNSKKTLEVAYKPEVTDPISETIGRAAGDLHLPLEAARVSTKYTFGSNITVQQASEIANRVLVNPTVQETVKKKPETLVIKGERGPVETISLADKTDRELDEISTQRKLHLNTEEMRVAQKEFERLGREATDVELEILGARWSEHCVHKTFNARVMTPNGEKRPLFGRIKDTSRQYFKDLVATAFEDNSGGMNFYDGTVVLVKWETHNSPSALDPFGGAATGSGGVFRDIMGTGKGAKVILSTDAFAVAPPGMDQKNLPPASIPPDNMLRGLVAGVRSYGNPMGIPTSNGSVHFHPDFAAKPTVLVGAYGITPEQYAQKGHPEVGDRVVAIGGRTGRDGIHGATVSSGARTEKTATADAAHVQIGNPIEEKKMADAILEARDKGLIRALTDCGAAGFSSAVGEMGEEIGVRVDISKAPLKYEGLSPWEIWISESQERMVLAIDPEQMEEFGAVCRRHGVEVTDLGEFDGNKKLTVTYEDEVVADLEYEFLLNGLPQRAMGAEFMREVFPEPEIEMPTDWVKTLKEVMSHGNVCSKQPIVEQYDTTVQGTNALAPFGGVNLDAPNDAVVIRPILDKPYGLVVSHGLNPILTRVDPERGAKWAATEAVSNLVAVGGDFREMVLCGNYVSPVPDRQYMGSLDIQVDSICAFQNALEVPVVSGKDSLSSTYTWPDGRKTHVPPVVSISTMGRIPDVEKTATSDFKREDSTIVMVGKGDKGMAGSTYFDTLGIVGNEVPDVDLEILPRVFDAIHSGIVSGEVKAAHDISEGGVIGAISEMCFGGGMGVELDIDIEEREDFFLFNETAGTFIVEVESSKKAAELFGSVPFKVLGRTTNGTEIKVTNKAKELFTADINELKEAWQAPMKALFH
ncbi:MAG: phosphoribosylformylglycinamidine synthase subunit PurL [Candidatus Levybacteria bacterium]|nr:phosphoribosylformylglycinamidine synthase subunit PurL [Candidatus Levybacteria bacterium]